MNRSTDNKLRCNKIGQKKGRVIRMSFCKYRSLQLEGMMQDPANNNLMSDFFALNIRFKSIVQRSKLIGLKKVYIDLNY